MKKVKTVFRFFSPAFALCGLLVFGMIFSGCNESDDSTTKTTWYMDADGDGYGNPNDSIQAEAQPAGYVADNSDCNDNDAGIHPGATEVCGDGIDQDCNGADLVCATTLYYKDADKDGYSDGTTQDAAVQPAGYYGSSALESISGDCNDNDAGIHPGATEVCGDGIDQDCNGSDLACATTLYYKDADKDGYSDGTTREAAVQPAGYYESSALESISGDCDDNDADVHPGAVEICNDGKDNDCNGNADCKDAVCANDPSCGATVGSFKIVDTSQTSSYDNDGIVITPQKGDAFYGQDAQHNGNQPSYALSGDGLTVTDNVTGLTWQKTPGSSYFSRQQAVDYCNALELGGYSDWRMPTLKELFSISDFSEGWPYLDSTYFDLAATPVSKQEQYWASDYYVGVTVEGGSAAAFGVNHGTGHIKAYPASVSGPMGKHVRAVRGNTGYGVNDFLNNGDDTITDQATGLMWSKTDSGTAMDWEDALGYAETQNAANYLGHNDWRLPNVKELQSIVDYTRSPSATDPAKVGPAIDPLFSCTPITNEAGNADYGYCWTNTSARFEAGGLYYYAWYVAFGMAVNGEGEDYHGAGAVRFDTKVEGGPAGEGDERIYNYVRLVRDINTIGNDDESASKPFINKDVFDFAYGDTDAGERLIDSQYASTAYYNMDETGNDPGNLFGVNFADGRIKGYGLELFGNDKTFFVMYVRDNKANNYGVNNFRNNGDGTITDLATGLMWMQDDSGYGMEWKDALQYCENLAYAGHTDWRLPDAKELQSIVDYSRMPDATAATTPSTAGAAINTDFFNITSFTNYNGQTDWGFFWSGTTHQSSNGNGGWGAYVAFGRALGNMGDGWVDVHGAGCQRSDPKYDDGTDYSAGHGPQGDAVYVYNYVRPVRNDDTVNNPAYVVVDTNQTRFWNNSSEMSAPTAGADFYGQDAQYKGTAQSYTDNGDGTVTDNNTGLMWQKSPDTNGDGEILSDDKYSYSEAITNAASCKTGGYSDWRLPTIKELYSLMDFSGEDVSSESGLDTGGDTGSTGEIDDTGDMGAQPELDFEAGAAYLAGLGKTITAEELKAIFGAPPPSAAELAEDLNITEAQAETLMNDYLGLSDFGPPPM
jgi:hypothetical protein